MIQGKMRCKTCYRAICRLPILISRSLEQLSFFVQNMGNFLQSTALLEAFVCVSMHEYIYIYIYIYIHIYMCYNTGVCLHIDRWMNR